MGKQSPKQQINRDGYTLSLWQTAEANAVADHQLDNGIVHDVIIVGAGITGVTLALLLQQAGKKCLLVEGHELGYGTTGGTSAHLNTFFDATYPEIESDFGSEASGLVARAGKDVMAMIGNLVKTYQIDCDLEVKKGFLFSQTDEETKQLAKILESSQKAGVAVTEAEENGLPVEFQRSLLFENQAQFHPVKYLLKLAEAFQKMGGRIIENAFVTQSRVDDNIYNVSTAKGMLKAKNLVYATHIPPGINLLSFRCAPYRSYVLGIRLNDGEAYPDCLAYDMQEPYHYFRTHIADGEKYLILGGEDHKTGHGDPEAAFQNLEAYARRYFKIKDIPYRWSAQYYVPVDGLPYIGKMPMGKDDTYIATGFNGNGMIFGTLSARIIADLILGIENPYAALFNPARIKPIAGFTEFVKENADVVYHFLADRLSSEALASLKEISPGEGRVVDFEGQKLAVYKSANGAIKALNPICTHAGCVVNFNPVEQSWDCPCHGGRFDLDGRVISGPPQKDLEVLK
jgi:glycine/D-amino acid oxidase-like deaminating enzyme/nitrite reductase/ring-hydroxylating ferredoxin subunit